LAKLASNIDKFTNIGYFIYNSDRFDNLGSGAMWIQKTQAVPTKSPQVASMNTLLLGLTYHF